MLLVWRHLGCALLVMRLFHLLHFMIRNISVANLSFLSVQKLMCQLRAFNTLQHLKGFAQTKKLSSTISLSIYVTRCCPIILLKMDAWRRVVIPQSSMTMLLWSTILVGQRYDSNISQTTLNHCPSLSLSHSSTTPQIDSHSCSIHTQIQCM